VFMPARSLLATSVIAAALVFAVTGCGSGKEPSTPGMPQIKAMRFAGADLEYALERIAAEVGMPLALDQIRPEDNTPDLGLYRVDVDLPAGPVDVALRKLKESAGGIDFEIVDGVIYVRSNMLVTTKTPIDQPLLPKGSFKGTINNLVGYIQKAIPKSYVTVERVVGNPEPPEVEFEIADKASVKDVLLQYARAAKLGWTMLRGGSIVNDPAHGVAVVGTSIQMRYPRTTTSRRPQVFNLMSTTGALASASARLGVPFVVLDRSVLLNTRGFLNLSSQMEQPLALKECLDDLAESGWGAEQWHFKWHMEGDVPVIESRDFLARLAGRDLLREELLAGEFEGSLPEFARWINTHRKSPSHDVLMGGEIAEGQKRGKLTIAPGTTLLNGVIAFAKASGVSVNFVLLGSTNPLSGKVLTHPNAWTGAYVQDLSEWIPTAEELQRASGVAPGN
jgi:hypothetical protein